MREVEGLALGGGPKSVWAGGWFALSTAPSVGKSDAERAEANP